MLFLFHNTGLTACTCCQASLKNQTGLQGNGPAGRNPGGIHKVLSLSNPLFQLKDQSEQGWVRTYVPLSASFPSGNGEVGRPVERKQLLVLDNEPQPEGQSSPGAVGGGSQEDHQFWHFHWVPAKVFHFIPEDNKPDGHLIETTLWAWQNRATHVQACQVSRCCTGLQLSRHRAATATGQPPHHIPWPSPGASDLYPHGLSRSNTLKSVLVFLFPHHTLWLTISLTSFFQPLPVELIPKPRSGNWWLWQQAPGTTIKRKH